MNSSLDTTCVGTGDSTPFARSRCHFGTHMLFSFGIQKVDRVRNQHGVGRVLVAARVGVRTLRNMAVFEYEKEDPDRARRANYRRCGPRCKKAQTEVGRAGKSRPL